MEEPCVNGWFAALINTSTSKPYLSTEQNNQEQNWQECYDHRLNHN